MQESSGILLHGPLGEKFVNHYTFYAAFASDEEFRIVTGGQTLGSIPVNQMLTTGQRILFAGKTWLVEAVDEPQKTIYVIRAGGGVPPLFSGGPGSTHTQVRQRIRRLLREQTIPPFLDATAQGFLAEAREEYSRLNLDREIAIDQGQDVMLLTWLGDSANEAIACLYMRRGFHAMPAGPGVEIRKFTGGIEEVLDVLGDIAVDDLPPLAILLRDAKNLAREKWDWALPVSLLQKAYASQHLDLEQARSWVQSATLPQARESP
jgi:ATP-dependent helicase Lhr and Lhr-like helicase